MYTHLLLISTVQISSSKFQEHIVLFSIIIYLLCQNKCFCDFYKFEQTCSNVQFIPSPIEVREFLLRLLNKIPAQNLFSLHIWQDLALLPHNSFHDREQIHLLTQALISIPFPFKNSVISSSTASSPSQ